MRKEGRAGRRVGRACTLACMLVMAVQASAVVDHSDHTAHAAHDHSSPDSYAPIGVMGDHVHPKGSFMVSYRYMKMRMKGNRDGTRKKSKDDLLGMPVNGDWPVIPTDMDMEMHMLGLMYAPHDRLTVMLMLPFVKKSMDHTTTMLGDFTTRSTGLGDISGTALIKLWEDEMHQVHLNAGLSFPTGSINRRDETPLSEPEDVILPYPMQIGSGTLDLLPGATYNGKQDAFTWGGQIRGTVRLGKNKENYRLGNQYMLTGWGGYKLSDWLSGALRMQYSQWFNIKSKDRRLVGNPGMGIDAEDLVPTADPDRRAGKRLDLGPSIAVMAPTGPLKGVRLAVEALFPLVRDLDGPQLETDWTLIAGIQYAF